MTATKRESKLAARAEKLALSAGRDTPDGILYRKAHAALCCAAEVPWGTDQQGEADEVAVREALERVLAIAVRRQLAAGFALLESATRREGEP